jgi:hypothetical protein
MLNAIHKEMMEMVEMRAWREEMDAETEAMRDKRMEANMNAWRKETMTCKETTEARLECKKPTPKDMEAMHWEVPKENAAMETGKTPSKRHRDRHLVAGRRGKPKELTRGDCGSLRNLAAACRKVSRRARVP